MTAVTDSAQILSSRGICAYTLERNLMTVVSVPNHSGYQAIESGMKKFVLKSQPNKLKSSKNIYFSEKLLY